MKIELEQVKDNEEGGVDLTFDLDDEGKQALMNEGVTYIILKTLSGMTDDEIFEALIDEPEDNET